MENIEPFRKEEEEEEEDYNYKFFEYNQERKELYEYCKAVAQYLRDENIANLVALDRSARPLYAGVHECWHAMFPQEKMPGIYFMNPAGFKSRDGLSEGELRDLTLSLNFNNEGYASSKDIRTKKEVTEEVTSTYKKLVEDKELPLLIFDSCMHSGETLRPVKETLENIGFSDIRIGTINPAPQESGVQSDLYITNIQPGKGCYPFDRDRLIRKTFSHVYSLPTTSEERRDESIELREEIKFIVNDFLKKDLLKDKH